jgi:1,4-alpha-glucan branching enzyme
MNPAPSPRTAAPAAPTTVPALAIAGGTAVSQRHVDRHTPLGATPVPGGVTFRVWAPAALRVYVITDDLPLARGDGWAPDGKDALERREDGTWAGFVAGLADGARYRFWVVGPGDAGFKRDPYARELSVEPAFPDCDCVVRDPSSYPWHDQGYRTPPFHELVVYQLHFGVFHATDADGGDARRRRPGKFLDLLDRIGYLRELGVNAIQPLPVQEYPSEFSKGYNGTDYFSPEMDYQVTDEAELERYLAKANALLAERGREPLELDRLRPGINQLKCVVDLCHLNGIAVIFDVVYNHAGGGFDEQSLWFLDRREKRGHPVHNHEDSLYFTRSGWAGGLVFDYAKAPVRRFLIDNARFLLEEYHGDGLRYDEVTVIDGHGGWFFCQELTDGPAPTSRGDPDRGVLERPRLALARRHPAPAGDGLRRRARRPAARRGPRGGRGGGARAGRVPSLDGLRDALQGTGGGPAAWRQVQCIENHDIVYADRAPHEWQPRLAHLADPLRRALLVRAQPRPRRDRPAAHERPASRCSSWARRSWSTGTGRTTGTAPRARSSAGTSWGRRARCATSSR